MKHGLRTRIANHAPGTHITKSETRAMMAPESSIVGCKRNTPKQRTKYWVRGMHYLEKVRGQDCYITSPLGPSELSLSSSPPHVSASQLGRELWTTLVKWFKYLQRPWHSPRIVRGDGNWFTLVLVVLEYVILFSASHVPIDRTVANFDMGFGHSCTR